VTDGAGDGVWKWVAAICVAIMLAGVPGIIHAVRSPTTAEVDVIRERQQSVLQRLAVLEVRIMDLLDALLDHKQDTG
jgi:di/tricarboxylate transporter